MTSATSSGPPSVTRAGRLADAAYLLDLNAEQFQACEQPVQSRLVGEGTVHDGHRRFRRGSQLLEVHQCLGR